MPLQHCNAWLHLVQCWPMRAQHHTDRHCRALASCSMEARLQSCEEPLNINNSFRSISIHCWWFKNMYFPTVWNYASYVILLMAWNPLFCLKMVEMNVFVLANHSHISSSIGQSDGRICWGNLASSGGTCSPLCIVDSIWMLAFINSIMNSISI